LLDQVKNSFFSNKGVYALLYLIMIMQQRRLDGHCGDVNTCRFFPSGVVVLSGGADCQLKIWSAETGKCAATLIGHQAGIKSFSVGA
jgi:WD40 repeat protein